jgi:hypothetical protein
MGLDMYAYSAVKNGQYDAWWSGADLNPDTNEFENPGLTKPMEIAYWRKHPNLHGWMEQLWREKHYPTQPTDATAPVNEDSDMFNGVELELTREDIDRLERDVTQGFLPETSGFFFGNNSDEHYKEKDLEFIKQARTNLFLGLRVFYNSSW